MEVAEKLEILADAAKHDVACTSSGVDRSGVKGKLGASNAAGCCHSFTADGRCVTLLKVLQSNACAYDCAYCTCKRSNPEMQRITFTPRELADLTIAFYRRNYIEGLFLSSAVVKSPDDTTLLMIRTLRILRDEYEFRGYIHAKCVPGTSPELIFEIGLLADRLSINLEFPSSDSLQLMAPEKSKESIFAPMRLISETVSEQTRQLELAERRTVVHRYSRNKISSKEEMRKSDGASFGRSDGYKVRDGCMSRMRHVFGDTLSAFAPGGQSTQMIIGATPESDHHILNLASSLYKRFDLKRVFFSAYDPIVDDPRLPNTDNIQLDREHRLYQADWLLRFYGFDVSEIIDEEHPFLCTDIDPKANWALNNLDEFPIEINTASYDMLLRVPGIGVKGAKSIIRARRQTTLGESELRKLGIAYKRARFFITCKGSYMGTGVDFSRDGLHAKLASPIDGGNHGRRSGEICDGQLNLFEQREAS